MGRPEGPLKPDILTRALSYSPTMRYNAAETNARHVRKLMGDDLAQPIV
jgi:hypothetical protein